MQPLQVTVLCLALTLTLVTESVANTDSIFAKFEDDHDLISERDRIEGFEYELFNFTFGGREHERVKRWQSPLTSTNSNPLCIMTFNIRTYKAPDNLSPRHKDIVITALLGRADLIAVQEILDKNSAQYILNLLNYYSGGNINSNVFRMITSGLLPSIFNTPSYNYVFSEPNKDAPRSEIYVIYYRTSILTLKKGAQTPPILLQAFPPIYQTRPPIIAEFTYSLTGVNTFDFTVITIHTKPTLNPKAEINQLHNILSTYTTSVIPCYSGNAIIMGDFNQGKRFVGSSFQSSLDQLSQYRQLLYSGGSTRARSPPQKHDRIYVHGYLANVYQQLGPVIPFFGTHGEQSLVQTRWNSNGVWSPIQLGVLRETVSDHYPVTFQIDPRQVINNANIQQSCTLLNGVGKSSRKRRATASSCEDCLAMTLTDQVFPPGTISSVEALNVSSFPIRRNDPEFQNLINLNGSPFVFSDEERQADWCGNIERTCEDCRGVSDNVAIVDQCSDRIMCPNLALKLIELLQRLQNCTDSDRSIIVHEAWDEPDSDNPTGLSSNNSLHTQGLEAIISVSEAIPQLPFIERQDYSSDSSLLSTLASLALCIGFDYVKLNSDQTLFNGTLSVAVDQCFDSQTRVPLCTKPSLENGDYEGAHEGSVYQLGEYISAVCLPGYSLSGGQIRRRCAGADDWSGEEFECIEVCEPYQMPSDSCTSTTVDLKNNLVEFKCLENCTTPCQTTYLKCNHTSREFEIVNFTLCIPAENITCDIIPLPYNGVSQVISGKRGETCSVVEFSCINGSNLIGNPILTCRPDGEYDYPIPSCSGEVIFTEFTVPGFYSFRASSPVNIRDDSSPSSANYSGELQGPFPPLASGGFYNDSLERVVFEEEDFLPIFGISLSFRIEVDLDIFSYITESSFHGRLENPFLIDVTGIFDGVDCSVSLSGLVAIPSQGLTVQADLVLDSCDNCTSICSAQAVSVMVVLDYPWNITLFGSYMLTEDDFTEVVASAEIEFSDLSFNISVALQSEAGELSIQNIILDTLLENPFNLELHGSYFQDTSQAMLSGMLDLSVVTLMLELTIDIETETISALQVSGNISSPFMLGVSGSYSLEDINSSQLFVSGSLNVPGLVNLRAMIGIDLMTNMFLDISFEGMLSEPLAVIVSGSYNAEMMDELLLGGNAALLSTSATIHFNVRLNISQPASIKEISLEGNFPSPLDFISYSGVYSEQCSCATLTGRVIQTYITAEVSTNLTFSDQTSPRIDELEIQVTFHRPLNFILTGMYRYSNDNTSVVDVAGQFEIPQVVLSTELQLLLEGMSSFTLTQIHFRGTFPPPLLLDVQGNYNISTSDLLLSGSLLYSFLQLNASVLYSFRDDMHNRSSMLSDVSFDGQLTDPFQLAIRGQYSFETSNFMLEGMLSVNEYLVLSVCVSLNTSSSPPSIDTINFAGTLTTPISFQGEFQGTYNAQTREALLNSHLDIMGALLLNATTRLTLGTNSEFSLQSVDITGTLDSPLFVEVSAVYTPSNATELQLQGQISIGEVSFTATAHAYLSDTTNQTVIREVVVSGMIQNPFNLLLSGTYLAGDSLLLQATLDLTQLRLTVMAPVNLSTMPREISSFEFHGELTSPLNASVSGRYTFGEDLVLSGTIDIASLRFTVEVFFNISDTITIQEISLNTSLQNPFNVDIRGAYSQITGQAVLSGFLDMSIIPLKLILTVDIGTETISALQVSGNISSPFMLGVSGSYSLEDTNSSQLFVSGSLNVPGLVNLRAMIGIDLMTNMFLDISFEGMLSEPLAVIVSGSYNAEMMDELLLGGNAALLSTSAMLHFNVRLNISQPASIKEISLEGNFPSPLDFISYSGVYSEQCSCATLTGRVIQTYITAEVSTNLTFSDQTSPRIDELEIQVTFHRPLNFILTGMYRYSNDNTSVVDVAGQFEIPQVVLSTELQLLLEGMSSFTLTQIHFRGTFPPPLSLDVQGNYNISTSDLLLSGSLLYSFLQLNASVLYSFRDDMHNRSSMLSDVSFDGQLTDPFQLAIRGQYSFETSNFILEGMLNVNEYLVLSVCVSLNTSSSPPLIDTINLAGTLTTPISFQGEFQGTYNAQTREALLNSHLDIMGALLLNATTRLTLGTNSEFSLQSVDITGNLDSPLFVEVSAVYTPSNATELQLQGQISIGAFSFVVTAHAENEAIMNQLVINEVTISGMIQNPFNLELTGIYLAGETLILRATLDFSEVHFTVEAPVNLTRIPREISSFQFAGQLTSPFNASVSGRYFSGQDLTLSGNLDLASLHFIVEVTLNTAASPLAVEILQFVTTYDPLSLSLTGMYNRSAEMLELNGVIILGDLSITAMASIDMSQQTRTLSEFSMSVRIENPSVNLLGAYNSSSQNALLLGELNLSSLEFGASALLYLGNPRELQQITFSLIFTIPFGSNLTFLLEGTYDNDRSLLILNSQIAQGGINALFIASTMESPTVRLISLIIPRLDIAALVNEYIGLNWPSKAFPLVFTNLAIYDAHADLEHGSIDYMTGFHARGEVKIFIFPRIIIDASLIHNPSQFRVSFQLADVLDWSIIAICGANDMSCDTTGPALLVQVGSGMNQFVFDGGIRFFDTKVGTTTVTVTKDRLSATFTLTEEIQQHFFGLGGDPVSVKVYWNDEGFYTNLQIPNLMIQDFKFVNVRSRSICQTLSGYISELAVDAPFNLENSFVAYEVDDTTLSVSVIFRGYVTLRVLNQELGLRANITPKSFGVRIQKGQPLSWNLFLKLVSQGLESAGQQIIDDLMQDAEAVRLFLAGRLGQVLLNEAAQAVCMEILGMPPPEPIEPLDPADPVDPAEYPEVPEIPFEVQTAATGGVIAGIEGLGEEGAALVSGIAAGAAATVVCRILKIFGGCSSNSGSGGGGNEPERDDDIISQINQAIGQTCSGGLCDQMCQEDGDTIICSCGDGYYLDSDQHSCVRFDRCNSDENPCDSNADCMDPVMNSMNQITCTCFIGFSGDGRTCSDIDECSDGTAMCPSYSTCSNNIGSFTCNCDSGFRKVDEICQDIDECNEGTASCPDLNSHCSNTPGSYECVCNIGFMNNGTSCIDIDECMSVDTCGPHSNCNNTIGSFSCQCDPGYKTNGSMCVDIDECSEGTPCDMNANCVNTNGSFTCECMVGYTGNGTQCTDIDECLQDDVCPLHSSCTNSLGTFSCTCDAGFSPSENDTCEDIDECDMSMFDCIPEAMCVNTIGSYMCTCLDGYCGNGTVCEDTDECNAASDIDECYTPLNVCSEHATCMNLPGSYLCQCDVGYRGNGTSCIDIDECAELPDACDQFASCENTVGSFNCTCNTGFTGDGHICTLISCPPLTPLPNTEFVFNNGNMYNQIVTFGCAAGFMPSDPDAKFELTCTSAGVWSSDQPSCTPDVFCPRLSIPLIGRVCIQVKQLQKLLYMITSRIT